MWGVTPLLLYLRQILLQGVQAMLRGTFAMMPTNMEGLGISTNLLSNSYRERIRPWLDAVDDLRNLGIMNEGIRLPTIVVVGDQSSGKSSVLESLAGIKLPTGQGICTRVPLILRLQSSNGYEGCEIKVEYEGNRKFIKECQIQQTIEEATREIAGNDKGISNVPITLHVRHSSAPDLTMVDLPGITRVPVHGQPYNIYDQISSIIKQYISPKESIILNVLSATVDFPTCESIRMSQQVDKSGERTLAVVTKADKAPEGLFEKVTDDAVNIGLGYICVRNRLGQETIEESREKESEMFTNDPYLCRIDKSMVGIPVLAEKLMEIQSKSIANSLPDIIKKIDTILSKRESELESLPKKFKDSSEAMIGFMSILDDIKTLLVKIFKQGEYEDFEGDSQMHGAVNLHKFLMNYCRKLQDSVTFSDSLTHEIKHLENSQGVAIYDFLSVSVFQTLIKLRIDGVSHVCRDLVSRVCEYVEIVITRAINMKTDIFPHLNKSARKTLATVMRKRTEKLLKYVEETLSMEKTVIFTENPVYRESVTKITEAKNKLLEAVKKKELSVNIEGVAKVSFKEYEGVATINEVVMALEMRMKIMAYWNVVKLRLSDCIAQRVRFVMLRMTEKELVSTIFKEIAGSNMNMVQRTLEESPALASRRKNLQASVDRLRQCKDVIEKLIGTNILGAPKTILGAPKTI